MATILGAVTRSHVPSIGGAIAKGLQQDPYWKPFFDGFPPLQAWLSMHDLVREAGAQGAELMTWIAARGALTGSVSRVHSSYHVPISNTAGASMLLENRALPAAGARAA